LSARKEAPNKKVAAHLEGSSFFDYASGAARADVNQTSAGALIRESPLGKQPHV
jgi:hypothetical protein